MINKARSNTTNTTVQCTLAHKTHFESQKIHETAVKGQNCVFLCESGCQDKASFQLTAFVYPHSKINITDTPLFTGQVTGHTHMS